MNWKEPKRTKAIKIIIFETYAKKKMKKNPEKNASFEKHSSCQRPQTNQNQELTTNGWSDTQGSNWPKSVKHFNNDLVCNYHLTWLFKRPCVALSLIESLSDVLP